MFGTCDGLPSRYTTSRPQHTHRPGCRCVWQQASRQKRRHKRCSPRSAAELPLGVQVSQSHTLPPDAPMRAAALQVLELQRRVQGTPYASHLQARSLFHRGTAPGGPSRLSVPFISGVHRHVQCCTNTLFRPVLQVESLGSASSPPHWPICSASRLLMPCKAVEELNGVLQKLCTRAAAAAPRGPCTQTRPRAPGARR